MFFCAKAGGQGYKMKQVDIFLPFYKLFVALFVFYLVKEALAKLGLIKSK